MKVIGIVGSRRRDSTADFKACQRAFLDIFEPDDTIVSGGCPRGGDRFAELLADIYEVPIKIHYPDWKMGRFAGLTRNTDIAQDADVLIAVVASDRKGGAEDTVRKATKLGKKIILV